MSQHRSLKIDSVGVKHRNVLKRFERIKKLQADNRWTDANSAFNLPKIKSMKVKVKKSAAKEPAAEGAATPGAAPVASKTEASSAKAAAAKVPAAKAAKK